MLFLDKEQQGLPYFLVVLRFMNNDRNRQIHEITGQLRLIWKEPILFLLILLIFYFLFTFVVFPIFQVVKNSVYIGGKWDFSNYVAIFSKRYFIQPFFNSIILGIYTATLGSIAGFIFAYALTRTSLPLKIFSGQQLLSQLSLLPS